MEKRNHKAHAAQWKKDEVKELENLIPKYKVIALVDMTNMPSLQLQRMRASLRDSVVIIMSKGNLIRFALTSLSSKISGIDKLAEQMRGMPALLLSNDNPFKVAKILNRSKTSAPAKGGQTAPNDILVTAGPTSFPPGPIIGELGQIGLKAGIVDGKVAVKEDKVVVKEGEVISPIVAGLLTRLGIEPMEIGINLIAALENGVIFSKSVLSIDEKEFMNNLKLAASSAFNLAFYVAYPTKDNIKLLIQKASRVSNAIADSQNILTSENVKKIVGKACVEAEVLSAKLDLPEQSSNIEEVKKKLDVEMTDEQVAQKVLKKLQDDKMANQREKSGVVKDPNFEKDEKVAQDILKKLQDDKIKK